MRIIGATHKGRKIYPPKKLPVRPTTDFAKEGLFNMLNNIIDFEELKVLDLFCGTGNISFEFASRGGSSITSVDQNYQCCDFIKKTIADYKMMQINIIKSDVFTFLKKNSNSYQLIFADPPYELDLKNFELIPELVFNKKMLAPSGWLIIEHGPRTNFSNNEHFIEQRKYGNVNFSFFN